MPHHTERPQRVWLLPIDGPPQRIDQAELEDAFVRYDDTGWEIKFEWLRPRMGCRLVDMRGIRRPLGEFYCDDEGLFADEPKLNPTATALYAANYEMGALGHPVAGVCIYVVHEDCPSGEDEQILMRAFEVAKQALGDLPHPLQPAT